MRSAITALACSSAFFLVNAKIWRFGPRALNMAPGGQAMCLGVVGVDRQGPSKQVERGIASLRGVGVRLR